MHILTPAPPRTEWTKHPTLLHYYMMHIIWVSHITHSSSRHQIQLIIVIMISATVTVAASECSANQPSVSRCRTAKSKVHRLLCGLGSISQDKHS